MSWQARLLCAALRTFEKPKLARAADPYAARRGFERSARLFFRAPRGTTQRWVQLGSHHVLEVAGPWVTRQSAVFYVHGGAYIMGSPKTHAAMLACLSQRTGMRILMPQYPLAPEAPFPAAFDAICDAYTAFTAEKADIVLGGDSAGGGLAFALLAHVMRHNLRAPVGAFGFSPFMDLTFSGGTILSNAGRDPLLPADRAKDIAGYYLDGADPKDHRASPLFANWSDAPPIWLTVDETEILRDDTLRFHATLKSLGCPVVLHKTSGLPHVWPMFQNYLPEARDTLDTLSDWITRLLAETGES